MPEKEKTIDEMQQERRDKRMANWKAVFAEHPEAPFQELMGRIKEMRQEISNLKKQLRTHIHVDGGLAFKDDRLSGYGGDSESSGSARQVLPPERR